MEPAARRRLTVAIEQASARAREARLELERRPDAPRSVETALREAEQALAGLAERLARDE